MTKRRQRRHARATPHTDRSPLAAQTPSHRRSLDPPHLRPNWPHSPGITALYLLPSPQERREGPSIDVATPRCPPTTSAFPAVPAGEQDPGPVPVAELPPAPASTRKPVGLHFVASAHVCVHDDGTVPRQERLRERTGDRSVLGQPKRRSERARLRRCFSRCHVGCQVVGQLQPERRSARGGGRSSGGSHRTPRRCAAPCRHASRRARARRTSPGPSSPVEGSAWTCGPPSFPGPDRRRVLLGCAPTSGRARTRRWRRGSGRTSADGGRGVDALVQHDQVDSPSLQVPGQDDQVLQVSISGVDCSRVRSRVHWVQAGPPNTTIDGP